MWKKGSLSGRLIIIYFLLVFIALTIVGVFILNQLEVYHLDNVSSSLTKVAEDGVLKSLGSYDSLKEDQDEIQTNIGTWYSAVQEEIFVVDENFDIVAASNDHYRGKNAVGFLDEELIAGALGGDITEAEGVSGAQNIPVYNMCFPIENSYGEITGVLYMRKDMTEIRETLRNSAKIFLEAFIIALLVTIVIGILISRMITRPINQLTGKAEMISMGDYKSQVDVKSDDEIGRLGTAFNKMAGQLDRTMSEISGEKHKLEIVLKTMADGLIAADSEGRIVHMNQTAKELLGVGSEESAGSYDELMEKLCPELKLSSIMESLSESEGSFGDEIFEYKGTIFHARYETADSEDSSGVSLVLVLQDITERQKVEQMQKDFVANVSHELNTPLTTIKSYTETILDSPEIIDEKEMLIRFLGVVDSEADRMSRLVKDLLQLSRLEGQREKWHKSVQNMAALVDDVVIKNSINAENKNQTLRSVFDREMYIPAYVDPDKIEQVLINIISNAIKYTEQNGHIDVDVKVKEDRIYISVADDGIGISEQEMPRLFERFYRVDKARSRSMGSGTGLGLSIARQIVEEHEGKINMESREGEGTTVTIVIPVFRQDKE